jgi:hypothetical protein
MRKQDIRLCVVYAYQRYRSGGEPEPVVFLGTGLWTRPGRGGDSSLPWCRPALAGAKAGWGYSGAVTGYLIVLCSRPLDGETREQLHARMLAVQADEASGEGELDGGLYPAIEPQLSRVTGTYADKIAEYEERRRRQHERADREEAAEARSRQRAAAVTEALKRAGVSSSVRGYGLVTHVSIPLEDAELLGRLLAEPQAGTEGSE